MTRNNLPVLALTLVSVLIANGQLQAQSCNEAECQTPVAVRQSTDTMTAEDTSESGCASGCASVRTQYAARYYAKVGTPGGTRSPVVSNRYSRSVAPLLPRLPHASKRPSLPTRSIPANFTTTYLRPGFYPGMSTGGCRNGQCSFR